MSDYSALKKAAEHATQGKWDYETDCLFFYVDGYTKHLMELSEGGDVDEIQQVENAKYIAAANPTAVLALIDDNERLKAAVYAVHGAGVAELHEQISQLKSENEKLKVDLRDAKDAKLGLSWAIGEIKAENEALRKAAQYSIDMFERITSADGSGHADLAKAVRRIAGPHLGNGE